MSKTTPHKSHTTLIVIILFIMLITAGVVTYFGIIKPQLHAKAIKNIKIDGVLLPTPKNITDFNLTDHHGAPFTKENLLGHWTMVFFGFTNCGYVCPVTLAELNKMYLALQKELPDAKLPQVVLVTVDPERDTTTKMNTYVPAFNSHFIGVRGSLAETEAFEKQLHIVAIKMPIKSKGGKDYSIDHSAEILLFNSDAQIQAYMSYPHKAEQMAKDYKLIVTTI